MEINRLLFKDQFHRSLAYDMLIVHGKIEDQKLVRCKVYEQKDQSLLENILQPFRKKVVATKNYVRLYDRSYQVRFWTRLYLLCSGKRGSEVNRIFFLCMSEKAMGTQNTNIIFCFLTIYNSGILMRRVKVEGVDG